jgi:hypothetical protein
MLTLMHLFVTSWMAMAINYGASLFEQKSLRINSMFFAVFTLKLHNGQKPN